MTKYQRIQVGDKEICVEIESVEEGIVATGGENILEKIDDAFGEAMSTIQTCAEGFVSQLSSFSQQNRPQEISLEFGLAFKAEAGIVVTKTSGEGNFQVSLTWKEIEPTA
jgi:hypothetical protein